MRVFDIYEYNVADRVKFRETKKYIDKMLADLGLKYDEISFTIENFITKIGTIEEKYPKLAGYRYYYEPTRSNVLTSLTPEWKQGKVYAKTEDREAIYDVFSKIPRGFNVVGSIIFQHIDWYGEGTKELAIGGHESSREKAILCNDYSALSSSIHMIRQYDDGNKINRMKVIVEATSDGIPKNTKEVIKKLEKYIGKPENHIRRCVFDDEWTKRFQELQEEAGKMLIEKINSDYHVDRVEYIKRMSDPFIPALVDKKMIMKAFADTNFSMVDSKKVLAGANSLSSIDRHNYHYEVMIDRTQMCTSFFRFYIFIRGCNFQIRNSQDVIFADSRGEAAEKLSRLADYCMNLQEEFGDYLSGRFGDTPEWYDWNDEYC